MIVVNQQTIGHLTLIVDAPAELADEFGYTHRVVCQERGCEWMADAADFPMAAFFGGVHSEASMRAGYAF